MRVFILLLFAQAANAAEVGVNWATYGTERVDTKSAGLVLKLGDTRYLWASYERPDLLLFGQQFGRVELAGAGVGVSFELADRLRGFIEFGIWRPWVDIDEPILHEVAQTYLNFHHSAPWGERFFDNAHHSVSDGLGGRVGVTYDIAKHIRASAAYRVLVLDEYIHAYSGLCVEQDWPPDDRCASWWLEETSLDMTAFEFGITYRF